MNGISRKQGKRAISYQYRKLIGNDIIKWAREHKEKTTDGRRVVGYATLPGGKIVVVMTSDTLEALQLHPNVRRGLSALDGCFKGFAAGRGAVILFGYFDRPRRLFPSHVAVTEHGESPEEVESNTERPQSNACGDCGAHAGPVHLCDKCGCHMHGFCGRGIGEEGYGSVKCADARSATTKTFKLAQKARTLFALHIIVVCCLMRSVREVNTYHVLINKSTALFIPSELFENGRDHTLCVASHLSCICVWADKPFANLINKNTHKFPRGDYG